MQDAWRSYLALAIGLTEAPRRKAQETARRLVGAGGATAVQLQAFAEELVSTSAANRVALTKLVRFEAERALGAVGLATADEVTQLTRRVGELERRLRETPHGSPAPRAADGTVAAVDAEQPIAPGRVAEPAVSPLTAAPTAAEGPSSGGTVTAPSPAKQAVVKKTAAKTTVAKKTAAKRAVAKKTAAKRAVAKKTAAKRAVAKTTMATRAVAKEAVPGRPATVRPATEMSPAPRSAKSAPRQQQPGGPE